MSEPITQAQIDKLFAAVPHTFRDVEIEGLPEPIPMRRVTIMEVLDIARKHSSLADALNRDSFNYVSFALEAGPDAIASFIATSAGHKGKSGEAFAQRLQQAPDEIMLPLGFAAFEITIGDGSIEDFFTRLRGMGAKAKVLKPLPAAA